MRVYEITNFFRFEQTQNIKRFKCMNSKLLGNRHCVICVRIKKSVTAAPKMYTPFDIPWSIVLDDSFSVFKCSSFRRGNHNYKARWQPTVGDEEKDNKYGKHVVAIIYDNFHSNNVAGHVPLYWKELTNKCLKLPNHHFVLLAKEWRVNRDIGLGLEIPDDYFFHGDNRVTEWFKKIHRKAWQMHQC